MSKTIDELREIAFDFTDRESKDRQAVPLDIAEAIITEQEQRIAELTAELASRDVERAELTALATCLEAERDAYRDALAKHRPSVVAEP